MVYANENMSNILRLFASEAKELGIIIVCRDDVQPDKSVVYMQDSLKLETTILHGNDSPFFSLILAKFYLVVVARVLSDLFLDSVPQFDHVSL